MAIIRGQWHLLPDPIFPRQTSVSSAVKSFWRGLKRCDVLLYQCFRSWLVPLGPWWSVSLLTFASPFVYLDLGKRLTAVDNCQSTMLENHRKGLIATEWEMVHWRELNLECYQKVIFLFEQKKLKNSASKFVKSASIVVHINYWKNR